MSAFRLDSVQHEDDNVIDLVNLARDDPAPGSRRNKTVNLTNRPSGSRPANHSNADVEEIIDLTGLGDAPLATNTATTSATPSRASKRQRVSPGKRALLTQPPAKQAKTSNSQKLQQQDAPPPPSPVPESPPGPTCGICLEHMGAGTSRQMWSATCGHIYCGSCLKSAVKATRKCPTCRKNLTVKQIHQVFL